MTGRKQDEARSHFTARAGAYRSARPTYPEALYRYLGEVAPGRGRVWDCGTGSGQAALGLAEVFDEVIATDLAQEQLAQAPAHPRVRYEQAPCGEAPLEDASADLVTVATAAHWFDLDAFYAEVRRVLRPRGVIAVWGYGAHALGSEPLEEATRRYAREIIGPYWRSENLDHIDSRYASLPFPFDEFEAPEFAATAKVDLERYLSYLGSWSASQIYLEQRGEDPLDAIRAEMAEAWGAPDTAREMTWGLFMRIGRVA